MLGAIFRERAQQHQVKQLKAQLLPSFRSTRAIAGQISRWRSHRRFRGGGRVYGQAQHSALRGGERIGANPAGDRDIVQARQNIDVQREIARANVSAQWGLIVAARGNVAAGKSAVEATGIALQGVREEEKVGQRTILDVLNAEQQALTRRREPRVVPARPRGCLLWRARLDGPLDRRRYRFASRALRSNPLLRRGQGRMVRLGRGV